MIMTVNVYEQYFEAEATFSGVRRRAALVMLVSDSEAGHVRYEANVTFFPHENDEDYAVSYDAIFGKVLYEGKGRRSKKKEQIFLETFRQEIDALSAEAGGKVFWDRPLREARRG